MNTLTTFDTSGTVRRAALPSFKRSRGESAWYQGYEMGMAFCRLTQRLSSQGGTKIEKEIRSLERALEKSTAAFCSSAGINLIDLGTGDGQKVVVVIKALNKAGIRPVRYVPVDTNPYISRYAIFTVLGGGRKTWSRQDAELLFGPLRSCDLPDDEVDSVSIESLVQLARSRPMKTDLFLGKEVVVRMTGLKIDFFQNLAQVTSAAQMLNQEGMSLFCLLGNTFGNYLPQKRKEFVTSLQREMKPGDLFLLGVGLRPGGAGCVSEDIRLLEEEYRPGESFMRLGADHPLSAYSPKYDPESCSVLHHFERPDKTIQSMGFSHLFDAKDLVNQFSTNGFELISCEGYPSASPVRSASTASSEPKYLTVLVRKT